MKLPMIIDGFVCDVCRRVIDTEWEQHMRDKKKNYHICKECCFIKGEIDEKTYLDWSGYAYSYRTYAGVNDKGKVEIWHGSKLPPWKRKKRK